MSKTLNRLQCHGPEPVHLPTINFYLPPIAWPDLLILLSASFPYDLPLHDQPYVVEHKSTT